MPGVIEAPRNLDYVRNKVVERAGAFPKDFLRGVPLRVTDEKTIILAEDLANGRFWGVLYALDGSNSPHRPDSPEVKEQKRAWAKKMFKPEEIDRLAQMSVDMAITVPFKNQWTGTKRGHSVLYSALIKENPGSLFEGKTSPELQRRIVNGTFWELIPDLSPSAGGGVAIPEMEEILRDRYDELDVQFASEGYGLFAGNGGEMVTPDLIYMQEAGIGRYKQFIRSVEQERDALGITAEQMGHLTSPIRELGSRRERQSTREIMREIGTLPSLHS